MTGLFIAYVVFNTAMVMFFEWRIWRLQVQAVRLREQIYDVLTQTEKEDQDPQWQNV